MMIKVVNDKTRGQMRKPDLVLLGTFSRVRCCPSLACTTCGSLIDASSNNGKGELNSHFCTSKGIVNPTWVINSPKFGIHETRRAIEKWKVRVETTEESGGRSKGRSNLSLKVILWAKLEA